ncbi:hypothetical protein PY650_24380 [Rhizobium calliandrae]|uniref:Uncharacterized protein n=1 Tax=Rhizobium calliandrae TaxID=1312182 RepID=A0ABT7KKP0_9HYPH|nr:hypothetical protein [Rhizobium calliandrae]MDL2408722.1 hypothetical protein [Rhizobium calliandrae]
MGPLVTLLLAQLSSTIIFILLAVLLRKIQIGMDPVSNVELGPLPDLEALGKALLGGMAMLVFWNGLTVIFYYTRCADLRCMNGEMIMGVRGPFSNVYYACYFGILAFAVPMWATFRMLRDWASRPEEKEEKPPQ